MYRYISNSLLRPSFYGFLFNAIIIVYALYLIFMNYKKIDEINLIYILLIASISFGIHNLHHYREETLYNYYASNKTSQEPFTTRL
jgi:hypothetical protein